jgi:hypothetical protein
MLGGGGARLPTPPTATTPDSILGREPPFLQRQTLNSSRRLQDRLASFRQQQSSNGGPAPVLAKQSQLLMGTTSHAHVSSCTELMKPPASGL